MNEWLNKGPEVLQPASSISPSSLTPHIPISTADNSSYDNGNIYSSNNRNNSLTQSSFCEVIQQQKGNAKKRWLRQAISEDQCDSPTNRPDSPPISDSLAPPKKRKLPRESLSIEGSPPNPPRDSPPVLVMIRNKVFSNIVYLILYVFAGCDGQRKE